MIPTKKSNSKLSLVIFANAYTHIRSEIDLLSSHTKPQNSTLLQLSKSYNLIKQEDQFLDVWNNFKGYLQQLHEERKTVFERPLKIKNFQLVYANIAGKLKDMREQRGQVTRKNCVQLIMGLIHLIEQIQNQLQQIYLLFYKQDSNKISLIKNDFIQTINKINKLYKPVRILSTTKMHYQNSQSYKMQIHLNSNKLTKLEFHEPQHFHKKSKLTQTTLATTRPSSMKSHFSKRLKQKQKIELELKQKQIFLQSFIQQHQPAKTLRTSKVFKRSLTASNRKKSTNVNHQHQKLLISNENKKKSVSQDKIGYDKSKSKSNQEFSQNLLKNSKLVELLKKSISSRGSKEKKGKNNLEVIQQDVGIISRRSQRRLGKIIQEPEELQKHNEEMQKQNPITYRDLSSKISHVSSSEQFDFNIVMKPKRRGRLTGSINRRKKLTADMDIPDIPEIQNKKKDLKRQDKKKRRIKKKYSSIFKESQKTIIRKDSIKNYEVNVQNNIINDTEESVQTCGREVVTEEKVKRVKKISRKDRKPIHSLKKEIEQINLRISSQNQNQNQISVASVKNEKKTSELTNDNTIDFAEIALLAQTIRKQTNYNSNILGGQKVENSVFFLQQHEIGKKETKKIQKHMQQLRNLHGIICFEPCQIQAFIENNKKYRMMQKERNFVFMEESKQLNNIRSGYPSELMQSSLAANAQF